MAISKAASRVAGADYKRPIFRGIGALLVAMIASTALVAGSAAASPVAVRLGIGVRPAPILIHRNLGPITAEIAPCSGAVVFRFTGGEQSCVVPNGVTTVEILAVGARGGNGAPGCYGYPSLSGAGGWGAQVISPSVTVKPGEQLYVEVGGRGGDASYQCGVAGQGTAGGAGWNGGGAGALGSSHRGSGGGGGASDVRTVSCDAICDQGGGFGVFFSLASRLVVAGGGGGGGAGGNAGGCPSCTTTGGAGGFAGSAGSDATISGTSGIVGVGGGAGSSNHGGAGGVSDPFCGSSDDPPPCTAGADGHLGTGGTGGLDPFEGTYSDGMFVDGYAGGAGGGGYWGGGGGDGGEVSLGNTVGAGGGGGGGSSFGPSGTIALPSPAEAYVQIIPLG